MLILWSFQPLLIIILCYLQSIGVAQAFRHINDVPNSDVRHEAAKGQHVIEADLACARLIKVAGYSIVLGSPHGRILLLPQPPEPVYLRMV